MAISNLLSVVNFYFLRGKTTVGNLLLKFLILDMERKKFQTFSNWKIIKKNQKNYHGIK